MKPIPGTRPMQVGELARVVDRWSFLYVERSIVHRDSNAITVQDERGTVHVPAAVIAVLMLGPGTTISHQAMVLLADSGTCTVWVGENGVRYYAHGRPLSRSSRLLEAQVERFANQSKRLAVARAMYGMRFSGEDVSSLTMQQLRGREGARVRRLYREHAKAAGVEWNSRTYRPDDFEGSDVVNQALSAATTCLYGVTHAAIVALGCSPALGFVHTGHDRSFVYDIADLYKMTSAVPVAFRIAAGESTDVAADVRRAMRDEIHEQHLLERCVRDIQALLGFDADEELSAMNNVVELWDPREAVAGGTNYGGFDEDLPW
jgi:CRISPR-associated protein Cas1